MAAKDPAADKGTGEAKRTVLDQSKLLGDVFDEDILSDIERHLEGAPSVSSGGARDKVELDKADLPLLPDLEPEPEPEAPPQLDSEPKVDLPPEEPEEPEEAPPAEPAAPPFWRRHLVPLAAGVLLAMGAGAGLQWALQDEPAAPPPRVVGQLPDLTRNLHLELEPFLVPLAKGGGGQLLRAGISLEGYDPMDVASMRRELIVVRDVIYRFLRERPASELDGQRMHDILGTRIRSELNAHLGGEKVRRVLLTQFLITG